jgi:hypothetical protein
VLKDFINNRIVAGNAFQAGELTLTPLARVFTIQFPGLVGGIVWNRPAGVRVSASGQADRFVPVYDYTRIAVWSFFALGLVGALAVWVTRRRTHTGGLK